MDDRATQMIQKSLQAAILRQKVISHNIANVNTPGYKRAHVAFESELSRAVAGGQDPLTVEPQVIVDQDTMGRPDGNNVDIELEMARMAENQIWHAALTRQLSDQFTRLRMVINGGRG